MKRNGQNGRTAVALGFFDGLHIAHRKVIETAAGLRDDRTEACVLLLDEHPQSVLNGISVPRLLQDEKRDALLDAAGVGKAEISFARIKDLSPEEFVRDILVGELGAVYAVCGYNYRFGKNGAGDTDRLKKLCAEAGTEVIVCPEVSLDGTAVSSTTIRKYIESGEVGKAAEMLGRKFSFSSEVITGEKRGRTLGTPTVNQLLPENFVVPAFGVYASTVRIGERVYYGVTDIGSRPTFGGGAVRSETFIFDFSGNLYGTAPEISLHQFIRGEKRFSGAEELRRQIAGDIETVKQYFLNDSNENCIEKS